MSPSMLKTLSVTTIFRREGDALRRSSRWVTSACRYTSTRARASRQPSTMEAWFHSSEKIVASGLPSVDRIPRLAMYPALNVRQPSVPLKRPIASSSSAWTSMCPLMSREAPDPTPYRRAQSTSAATTSGWLANPR